MTAPLVLIDDGGDTWRILGPRPGYGTAPYHSNHEDRRYGELCTVRGTLEEALSVLHRLEAS